ncbi:hypothetical protein [Mycobacteroides abscessus]|uniref:hypothetical protein n=1 Tax=Mycobacteroides abscessus TaxID=36809 RepID=UPI000C259F4E|nr:hypothetical protein [Mycobacteroides abscessus]
MAHISGEDQRRYAESHVSAEPVNIYDPDGAASGQYFMAKHGTGPHEARQQEAASMGAETDALPPPE